MSKQTNPDTFVVMDAVIETQKELELMDDEAYVQKIYEIIKGFEILNDKYDQCIEKINVRKLNRK